MLWFAHVSDEPGEGSVAVEADSEGQAVALALGLGFEGIDAARRVTVEDIHRLQDAAEDALRESQAVWRKLLLLTDADGKDNQCS